MWGHTVAGLQPCDAVEPKNSASVPLIEKQEEGKDGKVIVDYESDVDYNP